MRVAILTISDAASRGERDDASGPAAAEWAGSLGYAVTARALVPDDSVAIVRELRDIRPCTVTVAETNLAIEDDTTPLFDQLGAHGIVNIVCESAGEPP